MSYQTMQRITLLVFIAAMLLGTNDCHADETPHWLFDFNPAAERPAPRFLLTATSAGQTREKLRVELGKGFELAATQRHFVVAYPSGQKDQWSSRFEEIYNSFYLYFSVRGMKMREPGESLIVIVFPNQRDFLRYAASDNGPVSNNVLGYYSPRTNRVAMFDSGNGVKSDDAWTQNSETLIHELAHQISFNTGIHSRTAGAPRWLAEGLGTLFEARGVWKSRSYSQQKDRINRGRFDDYRRFASAEADGTLSELIDSDRMFSTSPEKGYALSWALTFYLTETQPRKYSDYLQLTSARTSANYTKADRLADFNKLFGKDLKLIETRFIRYMKEVKK